MPVQGRVLVVDDDRLVLSGIVAALEAAGFRVWAAESGEEAVRLVARFHPDIVVTDLRMPGMDGLALLERLRGSGDRMRRVIIYSATPLAAPVAVGSPEVRWVAKAPGHRALLDLLKEGGHATRDST